MKENKIKYIDDKISDLGEICNKLMKTNTLSKENEDTISYLIFNLISKQNKLFHSYYECYVQHGIEKLIEENFLDGDEILIDDISKKIHVKTNHTLLENIWDYQKTIKNGIVVYHKNNLEKIKNK